MEVQEMLRDVVREFVTSHDVEEIIRDEVRERYSYEVDNAIRNVAEEYVRERGGQYIQERIDQAINHGVLIDNGWGKTSTYETFDNFVRQKISTELQSSWQIDRRIRETAEKKIKEVCQKVVEAGMSEQVKEVMEELAQ